MVKYLISVIAIAFFIMSCSHGITRNFPTGENLTNPAEIIIIRNWNFFCGGQSTKILLDRVSIAHLRPGNYVSVFVEPGWHSFEAVPFIGEPGYISGHFEKGKKHYLLISLIFFKECDVNPIDLMFFALGAYSAMSPCGSMRVCEFEIENIGEERGLKRVKRSKNLTKMLKAPGSVAGVKRSENQTKMLKAHESVSKVPRTEAGSKKIASSINPQEPWTGVWDLKYYRGGGYILILKQNGSKVESTKDSKYTFFGNVEGDYLNGWITLPNRRPVFLKMSPDNRSFSGNFKDFGLTVYSSIWGKRRR